MGLQQKFLQIEGRLAAIEDRLALMEVCVAGVRQGELPVADKITAQIAELAAQGRSVREIANELGRSRSAVHRRLQAAAADTPQIRAGASWSTST